MGFEWKVGFLKLSSETKGVGWVPFPQTRHTHTHFHEPSTCSCPHPTHSDGDCSLRGLLCWLLVRSSVPERSVREGQATCRNARSLGLWVLGNPKVVYGPLLELSGLCPAPYHPHCLRGEVEGCPLPSHWPLASGSPPFEFRTVSLQAGKLYLRKEWGGWRRCLGAGIGHFSTAAQPGLLPPPARHAPWLRTWRREGTRLGSKWERGSPLSLPDRKSVV